MKLLTGSAAGAATRVSGRIPINDTARLYATHADLLDACLVETARSGCWLNGPAAAAFAAAFGAYLGVRHVVPVASGTDALELAMRAVLLERRPRGREAVTVANAGGYARAACHHAGLVPVFADVEDATQLVDPASLLAALGPETALVVVTHLYGGIVDVRTLREAMDAAGHADVAILEDCAQAHGGRLGQPRAGTMGDLAAFSFYPTKNLGALGDAGAVATSDDALALAVDRLRQYGWAEKYRVVLPGGRNSRMDEVQAAVLSALLPHLDGLNRRRVAVLDAYRGAVGGGARFVAQAPGSVAHLAVALCPRRDAFRRHLDGRGIDTAIHYPLLDCDQPGWAALPSRVGPTGLDRSRASRGRIVTLPCFPTMTDAEVCRVTGALGDWGGA